MKHESIIANLVNRKTSGFKTREESRAMAKALRTPRVPGVTVKADVKGSDGWGIAFKHVGGTLSLKK